MREHNLRARNCSENRGAVVTSSTPHRAISAGSHNLSAPVSSVSQDTENQTQAHRSMASSFDLENHLGQQKPQELD